MASLRFFSRLSRKTIDIRNVRKDKFMDAVEFMKNNFIDDPLMRSMGITARNKDTEKFLSALWLTFLRSDLSLAAINGNKICGLSVNSPMITGDGQSEETLLQLSKAIKTISTRNLLQAWHKIEREAPLPKGKKPNGKPKRILELAGLAVSYRNRGKGIGKELVQSSANLAMLLGFDYLRVDCTNPNTAKICDKMGWEKVWEMPFDKFEGVLTSPSLINEFKDFAVKVYVVPLQRGINKS